MAGLKTGENTQFARVSDAAGNAPVGTSGAENDGLAPLCDAQGRLIVVPAAGAPLGELQYSSPGISGARVVSAAPATLLWVAAGNLDGARLWFQLYDKAAAPAGGDTPIWSLPLLNTTSYIVEIPGGWACANGIALALSNASSTYVGPPAGGWFTAKYK